METKAPLILFDLDETLYLGDLVKVAHAKLMADGIVLPLYTGADVKDFQFSNLPEILRQYLFETFKDPIEAALNKKLLCGAYPFIYFLKRIRCWKIGVVTARPSTTHEATKFCLWRDFPNLTWDEIRFANTTGGHKDTISKADIIKELQPTFYFDDHYDYCLEAKKASKAEVYMISNKHTGWNHDKIPEARANGIKIVKSILEFDVLEKV